MDIVYPLCRNIINGLIDGPLGPYVDAFNQNRSAGGYAAHTLPLTPVASRTLRRGRAAAVYDCAESMKRLLPGFSTITSGAAAAPDQRAMSAVI